MKGSFSRNFLLLPVDNNRLAKLCGQNNENLKQIEQDLDVVISNRGNQFQLSGASVAVNKAETILNRLYQDTGKDNYISSERIHLYLQDMTDMIEPNKSNYHPDKTSNKGIEIHTKAGAIKGYTANQRQYLENISKFDINISIGPAGTGKTYLAVASAVDALEKGIIRRILLVRPAVEAGEKLGFLPGGLEEKIEPYLRPLYDALFEMIGFDRVGKLIEQNIIEVAPLAYMRGRTLNDSFIILDESQNTTTEQMKMFLTRIGFNSKAIITGDITQIDLPRDKKSGLTEAIDVLKDIDGICFTYFDSKDVVRHALVQRIIEAYAKHEQSKNQ